MDISTIIGLVLGIFLIFGSIFIGGGVGTFINIPSVLIVIGGTIAALLIAYPLTEMAKLMKIVKNTFISQDKDPTELIVEIIKYTLVSKQQGSLVLIEHARKFHEPFLFKGIQMLADGASADTLDEVLNLELTGIASRHNIGQEILQDAGSYAPAFGMIGTLIGLVQMLSTLDDPKTIGPKMAVALITTFYGALVANLVCIPMKKKLKIRSDKERLYKRLVIVGVLSIEAKESAMVVEDKLKATLSKALQEKVENKKKNMKKT